MVLDAVKNYTIAYEALGGMRGESFLSCEYIDAGWLIA